MKPTCDKPHLTLKHFKKKGLSSFADNCPWTIFFVYEIKFLWTILFFSFFEKFSWTIINFHGQLKKYTDIEGLLKIHELGEKYNLKHYS